MVRWACYQGLRAVNARTGTHSDVDNACDNVIHDISMSSIAVSLQQNSSQQLVSWAAHGLYFCRILCA